MENQNVHPIFSDILKSIQPNLSETRKQTEPKLFRLHPSQAHKVCGAGKAKSIPKNASKELTEFITEANKLQLSGTCWSYLKEWYSDDKKELHTKEIVKGNLVESDSIDFAARVLGYGLAEKNVVTYSNEFFIGTPDIVWPELVCDVKNPYDRDNFLDNLEGIDPAHELQLRCYLPLTNIESGLVFYSLMNTPAQYEDQEDITYDHLPESERWVAYQVKRDTEIEQFIISQVHKCRIWLDLYHRFAKSRTGRVVSC